MSDQATSSLGQIPFSTIIGAPLMAAVRAQALASKTSYEFIAQVGFNETRDKDNKVTAREAINVNFNYIRGGKVVTLNVPLLTILPVPYFEIKNMDIAFKANISAEASTEATQTSSNAKSGDSKTKVSANVGWGWWGAKADTTFNAGYSSKKDSVATQKSKYSVEYTMDIKVNAGQGDMPAGLATVLNILQDSIEEASSSLIVSNYDSKVTIVNARDSGITFRAIYDGNILIDKAELYVKLTNGDEIGGKFGPSIVTADEHGKFIVKLVDRGGSDAPDELKAGTAKFLVSKDKNFKEAVAFSVELTA